jgi:hypothetical protein
VTLVKGTLVGPSELALPWRSGRSGEEDDALTDVGVGVIFSTTIVFE